MATSYTRYRVRHGFGGVCILQQLVSYPTIIGGKVDSSVREFEWMDVPYKRAPSEFEIVAYRADIYEVFSNEKSKDEEK